MVRHQLKDIITDEDQTLKRIEKDCKVVSLFYYGGNISSIMFAPIVYKALDNIKCSFDLYENNVYIYAKEKVVGLPNTLALVVDTAEAGKIIKAVGKTIYSILNQICEQYYYDKENIVFLYRVPEKYTRDYELITQSNYTGLSKAYVALTEAGDLVRAIVNNSSFVYNQWKTYETMIGLVKDERKVDAEPVSIVTKSRNFPEFNLKLETYNARTKD
jgi:asparagine N-glycosylation enzyme membrane subunit Stt3